MNEITDMVLMNIVFWTAWGCISYLPLYLCQRVIDTY